MNSTALTTTHIIVVNIFLLIYVIKTILLFANRNALAKFTRITKVPEMIVSVLFLATGIWLFALVGAIKVLQIVKLALVVISIPVTVIAFKKMNKVMAVLSLLLIVGAYGISEAGKGKPYIANNVVVKGSADETTKLGALTYMGNCAMCHGEFGKKKYRNAADLSVSVFDAATAALIIKEGSKSEKGRMPAFAGLLSDEQIAAAAVYIQGLKGK